MLSGTCGSSARSVDFASGGRRSRRGAPCARSGMYRRAPGSGPKRTSAPRGGRRSRAERGVVLERSRGCMMRLRSGTSRDSRTRAPLGLRDAQAPALLEERQVRVRPTEQEHLRLQRICPRQRLVLSGRSRRRASRGSRRRDRRLHGFTMSVSGEHAALRRDVVQLLSSKAILTTSSFGRPTFSTHLSIVAPVPDAHLSFIDVDAVLSPVLSFFLKI